VIDGIRIDLTADELIRHLDERIQHHHDRAAECDRKARNVADLQSSAEGDDDEDPAIACWPSMVHDQERRAARHRSREALLVFLRNHVVANEIYRLSERDLKSVELLPADETARLFLGD
jgi:hypothetical protein